MGTALHCLDENSALDFLSGRLGAPALAETERHLGVCAACVELLARSVPFLPSRHGDYGHLPSEPRASPAVSTLAIRPQGRREPRRPRTVERDPEEGGFSDASAGDGRSDVGRGDDDHEGAPTLTAGTVLKGTYTVMGLIGRGGMGEVYEVTHARLAGRYALKLLPPAFAHDHVSLTRFRREADITSALRHPNIVQVIDFDHTPAGQPFLVMEHLDGGDLAQLMAARGPMPLERVLPIVAQIVSALSAVHRRGIVHRDLKPQNVLLVRDDDLAEDRVKLVDFGLSKRSDRSLLGLPVSISRDRTLLGTPRYMAPEQASGRIDEIDATTDQFALGAMVYEMLTGTCAFDGDHIALLLYRIVSEEPAPLRSILSDVPDHLEQAIRRAMSKQRADRFPTVNEFFEALSGQPQEPSSPLSPSERGARAAAVASSYLPSGRLVTPRATTPMPPALAEAAPPSAPGVDSIHAMELAGRRRRRVGSFAIGLGAAVLLAAALSTYRASRPDPAALPPAAPTSAAAPAAPPPSGASATASAPVPSEPAAAPEGLPGSSPASAPQAPPPDPDSPAPIARASGSGRPEPSSKRPSGGVTGRRNPGAKRRAAEWSKAQPTASPSAVPGTANPAGEDAVPPAPGKKAVGILIEAQQL